MFRNAYENGIIGAFVMFKGTVEDKFSTFAKGVGNEDIIIMCMIYLLAGGFAQVSREMGGVDSVVNLGLSVLPPSVVTAGLFLVAALMSTATGTSMDTLSAPAPPSINNFSALLPVTVNGRPAKLRSTGRLFCMCTDSKT